MTVPLSPKTTGSYPGETEVLPGVYLSSPHSHAHTTAPPAAAFDYSNADVLLEEITRLRRSVEVLLESNRELRMADPTDPDFIEAIEENTGVISRRIRQIAALEQQRAELLGTPGAKSGGPCRQELGHLANTTVVETAVPATGNPEGGVSTEVEARATGSAGRADEVVDGSESRENENAGEQNNGVGPDDDGGVYL